MKKTISRSKRHIKAHDIFFSKHFNYYGEEKGHYFYCVYARKNDGKTSLHKDVIGFFITTKENKDYSVKIKINDKDAYVNCDQEYMFLEENVVLKNFTSVKVDREKIVSYYKKSVYEKLRQLKKGV